MAVIRQVISVYLPDDRSIRLFNDELLSLFINIIQVEHERKRIHYELPPRRRFIAKCVVIIIILISIHNDLCFVVCLFKSHISRAMGEERGRLKSDGTVTLM